MYVKMMSRSARIVRYAWASPYSFAGLLLALVAILSGASLHLRDGTLEVAGGRIGAWVNRLPRSLRFYAITLGHVILGSSHDLLDLHRAHERTHVRQYERWGVLFVPLYLLMSLLQVLRGRDPYRGNTFEREAGVHPGTVEGIR
ncbi:MAG TPA: hypothetical protein PLP82_05625 [Deltaproteobacteria bacterium]|nr:hypothetical protein [Deltaproteobacteria bacterium]HNS89801.1 hypothetical protein [Deltaproteobacteria bacterium]HOA44422.1 hypothetical protein [Deltaproteobacteria bacterium]HOC75562.1 hypothetical protein [Deltaproteobacteria bacterium]HOG85502.1 hypothetical protein [Deltaproteobacteria bacterium]